MAKSLEKAGMDMKSELIHYIRVGGVIQAECELSITIFNCYKGDRDGLERSFSQRWRHMLQEMTRNRDSENSRQFY